MDEKEKNWKTLFRVTLNGEPIQAKDIQLEVETNFDTKTTEFLIQIIEEGFFSAGEKGPAVGSARQTECEHTWWTVHEGDGYFVECTKCGKRNEIAQTDGEKGNLGRDAPRELTTEMSNYPSRDSKPSESDTEMDVLRYHLEGTPERESTIKLRKDEVEEIISFGVDDYEEYFKDGESKSYVVYDFKGGLFAFVPKKVVKAIVENENEGESPRYVFTYKNWAGAKYLPKWKVTHG